MNHLLFYDLVHSTWFNPGERERGKKTCLCTFHRIKLYSGYSYNDYTLLWYVVGVIFYTEKGKNFVVCFLVKKERKWGIIGVFLMHQCEFSGAEVIKWNETVMYESRVQKSEEKNIFLYFFWFCVRGAVAVSVGNMVLLSFLKYLCVYASVILVQMCDIFVWRN